MTTQTVLTVGSGEQFASINAAIEAADSMGGNADIQIQANTYTNDGGYLSDGINNVTIEGVGGMVTIVDPSYYAGGKAAIVTGGDNIVLKNLDISGVTVPDGNGAAVRYDQGSLTLDHVIIHGNQDGLLGAADPTGSITVENSEFYNNGTSAGNTHNIYIGDIAQFTLQNSYIHDANVGHEVKSRAENDTIVGNIVADNFGTSSYAIDLPNGGNATVTGNIIEQGPNNQNHIINSYGEEGNLHSGASLTFSNNEILNDDPNGAGPLWQNDGATITGSGNVIWNTTDLGSGIDPSGYSDLLSEPDLGLAEQAFLASFQPTLATDGTISTGYDYSAGTGGSSGTTTDPQAGGGSSASTTQPNGGGSSEPGPTAPAATIISDDMVGGMTYRFMSTVDGSQFLSTSPAEVAQLLQTRPDLVYEGAAFSTVTSNSDPASSPVFRFFDTNSGAHFYTINSTEKEALLSSRPDLVYEGTAFNADTTQQAGDVPVYRFFETTNGTHFYTDSTAEQSAIFSTRPDMVSEGIAFYVPGSS